MRCVSSCGSVRPTRGIDASSNIPHTSNFFILHLRQSLSIATLPGGMFHYFRYVESVSVPCCSETWKHDLGPRCGPYESFLYSSFRDSMIISSRSFFEHEEFSLFVFILDQSLAQVRFQLEPFGLAGLATVQGIAEALLISNFLPALFMISPKSSSAASNFAFSSARLFMALR